jgi:hypothetical protein
MENTEAHGHDDEGLPNANVAEPSPNDVVSNTKVGSDAPAAAAKSNVNPLLVEPAAAAPAPAPASAPALPAAPAE